MCRYAYNSVNWVALCGRSEPEGAARRIDSCFDMTRSGTYSLSLYCLPSLTSIYGRFELELLPFVCGQLSPWSSCGCRLYFVITVGVMGMTARKKCVREIKGHFARDRERERGKEREREIL